MILELESSEKILNLETSGDQYEEFIKKYVLFNNIKSKKFIEKP